MKEAVRGAIFAGSSVGFFFTEVPSERSRAFRSICTAGGKGRFSLSGYFLICYASTLAENAE